MVARPYSQGNLGETLWKTYAPSSFSEWNFDLGNAIYPPTRRQIMLDVLYLGLGVLIFAGLAAYVRLCDRI
jgi:hypothetical protein